MTAGGDARDYHSRAVSARPEPEPMKSQPTLHPEVCLCFSHFVYISLDKF